MSLIRELGNNLQVVTELVAKMRSALNTCENDSGPPLGRVKSGADEVSSETKQVQTRLAEMDSLIAQVKTQLTTLQEQLSRETNRLATEGQQRVEAMEKNGTDVQTRFQTLTQAVKQTMEDVDRRAEQLRTSAGQLSDASKEQGENLERDYKAGTATLEASAEVVKTSYQTDLFSDLSSRLQALQADLHQDATEVVPSASLKLADTLAGEHTNGVKESLKTFGTTAQATLADFLSQARQTAAKLQQAEEADVKTADQKVRQELPEQAKTATTKADNAVKANIAEMTELSKYSTQQQNFMNDHLKKWLEPMEQLHIALENMIGGKGK